MARNSTALKKGIGLIQLLKDLNRIIDSESPVFNKTEGQFATWKEMSYLAMKERAVNYKEDIIDIIHGASESCMDLLRFYQYDASPIEKLICNYDQFRKVNCPEIVAHENDR